MIKVGQTVADSITGYTGMAIARTEYLNGCVQFCVQAAALHDGKPVDEVWFDAQRLGDAVSADTGGPGPTPPARTHG